MCCAGRLPVAAVAIVQELLSAAYVAGVVPGYDEDR
jgi:hypothetical protein